MFSTSSMALCGSVALTTPIGLGQQTLTREALEQAAVPIRSIDPGDQDFTDLEPLVERIGSARIVVLGEATHSEGSTLEAKARLAMFLHQRMGFDVLAWEAGVLDCAAMDRALGDSSVDLQVAAQEMMRGGWDAAEEAWPLFEYVRETWKSARPLRMAGFDGERPPHGSRHFLEAVADLEEAGVLDLETAERRTLQAFATRAFGYLGNDPPLAEAAWRREIEVLDAVEAALHGPAAERRLSPISRGRLAASLLLGRSADERRQRRPDDTSPHLHPRDPSMGRAFRWLAEEFHGRRIIIWAATAHLTRNTRSIRPIDRDWDYSQAEHMGDTVFADFGPDLYTIAVVSHHGLLGTRYAPGSRRADRTQEIEAPPAGSFEALAHQLGEPYLFVDLRGAAKGSALRGEFVARPLGFIPSRAVWAEVLDAFFFIDAMEPERRSR